jgi:hypothetical protein
VRDLYITDVDGDTLAVERLFSDNPAHVAFIATGGRDGVYLTRRDARKVITFLVKMIAREDDDE